MHSVAAPGSVDEGPGKEDGEVEQRELEELLAHSVLPADAPVAGGIY